MEQEECFKELEEMEIRLVEDGMSPEASMTQRLLHLWKLYRRTENSLGTVTHKLKSLQSEHVAEKAMVQKTLEQIRALSDKQNLVGLKYGQENQMLHTQLKQMSLQQDSQKNEVAEMLYQAGLVELIPFSPSEQVAYLLAERSSLLERPETLETKAGEPGASSPSSRDTMPASTEKAEKVELLPILRPILQTHGQSPWKKLLGLRKVQSREKSFLPSDGLQSHKADSIKQQHLERDLDEASRRLSMAHKEIRRLTDELESAHLTQSAYEPELQGAQREVELLRREVEKLKRCDVAEIRRAKEQNECLDQEIRVLRERVRSLDAERLTLLNMLDKNLEDNDDESDVRPQKTKMEGGVKTLGELSRCDEDRIHKRCREVLQEKEQVLGDLQRHVQQQQEECEALRLQKQQVVALLQEAQSLTQHQEQKLRTTEEDLRQEMQLLKEEVRRLQSALHTEWQQSSKLQADIEKEKDVSQSLQSSLQEKIEDCRKKDGALERSEELFRTLEKELQCQKSENLHLVRLMACLQEENQKVCSIPQKMQNNRYQLHQEWNTVPKNKFQRKLWDHGELHESLLAPQDMEITLKQFTVQLSQHMKDLEIQLDVLQKNNKGTEEELKRSNHDLEQRLHSRHLEVERLETQLKLLMIDLDSLTSKYNEKQCQHKTKMSRAKQAFLKEICGRDEKIQRLERDLNLLIKKLEKEKDLARNMGEVNSKLLLENNSLQPRLIKEQNKVTSTMCAYSAMQRRVEFLEKENRQLEDSVLEKSSAVAKLECVLGSKELEKLSPQEWPIICRKSSLAPKGCDLSGLLDLISTSKVKCLENLRSSITMPQMWMSELGYLNLTSSPHSSDTLALSDCPSIDRNQE
ncbi:coiled-coil domain-containing protein 30 [Denticeps clupeoides]|uniref:coiled-coil domain-containing protein 30 n=1 Tax=Denticeps clupeoides TaxID=299321 RepID=UPI0010A4DB24|nr:coiled-coil domain-containing protein 30-like [Denticeps clupeoides]